MRGLDRLQAGLDAHEEPDDWPEDVCRDAWCGQWERNNGQYFWHRPSDHMDNPGPPVCGGNDGICAWNPTCHARNCVNFGAVSA